MKCYFCDESNVDPNTTNFDCKCGTEYIFHTDGELFAYRLHAMYNNRWWFGVYFVKAGYLSGKFHVKDSGYQTAVILNFDPKITPTNFSSKLPTLLTFS